MVTPRQAQPTVKFIILNQEKLNFALAIRSNHGMGLPSKQKVRYNKWRERETRYWQVTKAPESLPENST